MSEVAEALRRFSDSERRQLLTAPGIGPAVIDRLEGVGIHTLAQLRALGGEQAARRVGAHLQRPSWANRGRVLQRALVALSMAWAAGAGQAAADCAALRSAAVPDVRVSAATAVAGDGDFRPPQPGVAAPQRAFCRVQGVIETEIGFELWLPPPADWNGKLLGGGVGGQAGNLNWRELVRGLRRGYASASTDTGHLASDRHWLLGDPQRALNYAHRANHLLAVKAKALIQAYYGRPPRQAYFVGCSGGGRQALVQAQRWPGDYDGIIAGAPAPKTPEMSARRLWEMLQHDGARGVLDAAGWRRAAQAANEACDAQDGLRDGLVDEPMQCRFSWRSLRCAGRGADGAFCLDDAQLELVERIHAPLHDEDGRRVDDGLLPGVVVRPDALPEPFTPGPPYLAMALFGDGVHGDPNWDPRRFRIARDLPAIERLMPLRADDADLSPFVARGGRLIVYQGWADPLVAAQPTLQYVQAVQRRIGAARAQEALRLFMVPGMDHCVGGTGPDRFGGAGGDAPVVDAEHDLLSALERWVEDGRAPERIVAQQLDGERVRRTRPLCAWPRRAQYRGSGPLDEAASFDCR